jgi:hypothetical protein
MSRVIADDETVIQAVKMIYHELKHIPKRERMALYATIGTASPEQLAILKGKLEDKGALKQAVEVLALNAPAA